jgi:hypothetical protein
MRFVVPVPLWLFAIIVIFAVAIGGTIAYIVLGIFALLVSLRFIKVGIAVFLIGLAFSHWKISLAVLGILLLYSIFAKPESRPPGQSKDLIRNLLQQARPVSH